MISSDENNRSLTRGRSGALEKAEVRALTARGYADLRVIESARQWLRKGLEHRELGQFEQAFDCFSRGIQLNPHDTELQKAIAIAYEEGQGVPQDCGSAAVWYRRAARQKDQGARSALDALYERPSWKDFAEHKDALLFDGTSGISNRRAFEEARDREVALAVGVCDSDDFNSVRYRFGRATGDLVVRAMVEAFKQVGLEVYNYSQDIFMFRGTSSEALVHALESARTVLKDLTFVVRDESGRAFEGRGLDFVYGVGSSWSQAEQNKRERNPGISGSSTFHEPEFTELSSDT
jgi:GGDEF domain-containing protein